MTDDVKNKLKEWSKFTKIYYKSGNMKSDLDKLIPKSNECAEAISVIHIVINILSKYVRN